MTRVEIVEECAHGNFDACGVETSRATSVGVIYEPCKGGTRRVLTEGELGAAVRRAFREDESGHCSYHGYGEPNCCTAYFPNGHFRIYLSNDDLSDRETGQAILDALAGSE